MSRDRWVHQSDGPIEAVEIDPVRAPDGTVDVEATVRALDKKRATESARYRFSPLRRWNRTMMRRNLSMLND